MAATNLQQDLLEVMICSVTMLWLEYDRQIHKQNDYQWPPIIALKEKMFSKKIKKQKKKKKKKQTNSIQRTQTPPHL